VADGARPVFQQGASMKFWTGVITEKVQESKDF